MQLQHLSRASQTKDSLDLGKMHLVLTKVSQFSAKCQQKPSAAGIPVLNRKYTQYKAFLRFTACFLEIVSIRSKLTLVNGGCLRRNSASLHRYLEIKICFKVFLEVSDASIWLPAPDTICKLRWIVRVQSAGVGPSIVPGRAPGDTQCWDTRHVIFQLHSTSHLTVQINVCTALLNFSPAMSRPTISWQITV